MADSYQPIYDAVRSRISGGNISDVIRDVARKAFDISRLREHAMQEIYAVSYEYQRPSVLFRPEIFMDGTAWCALYGADLMAGVAGFGDSPELAMRAFDAAWQRSRVALTAQERDDDR